ncbi:hypothetical protein ABW21_db0208522 [Orbilia brochopaga]|nr:hypothetical protein ABW21_db0208522 [Drechslerella brochopaga]
MASLFKRRAANPEQKTNFFSLPRELRDDIYDELVLFDLPETDDFFYWQAGLPSCVFLHGLGRGTERCVPPRVKYCRRNLSIFRVCRQTYLEASERFYSQNVFPIFICIRSTMPVGFQPYADLLMGRFTTVTQVAPWESLEYVWQHPHPSCPVQNCPFEVPPGPRYIYRPGNNDICGFFGRAYPALSPLLPRVKPCSPIPSSLLTPRASSFIRRVKIHLQLYESALLWPQDDVPYILRAVANRIKCACPLASRVISFGHCAGQDLRDLMPLAVPLVTGSYKISIPPAPWLKPTLVGALERALEEAKDLERRRKKPEVALVPWSQWGRERGRLVIQALEPAEPRHFYVLAGTTPIQAMALRSSAYALI